MNRPLETTFWMRFTQFIKGVFLYNTIYWKRASDDLNIRHMSREERASLRPKRNLDIIRPRGNPRPTVASAEFAESPQISEPLTSSPVAAPAARLVEPPTPVGEADADVEIHRRKKRRRSRHSKVVPKHYYDPSHEGSGFFGRWFK